MSAFRRFQSRAGDVGEWIVLNIFPWLLALMLLGALVAAPLWLLFAPKPPPFAEECRATCTASGMVMTGIEFGSKRQCKCEVLR